MKNRVLKVIPCVVVIFIFILICFLVSNDVEKGISLYDVFLNLSYSLIAASIFYIINEVLPNINHRQKAMKVLQSHFIELYSNVNLLIAVEKFRCGCTKENRDLTNDDFTRMFMNDNNKIYVNGYIRIDSNDYRDIPHKEWIEPITDTVKCAKKIRKKTQEILSNSISKYLDENLLDVLSEIQLSPYLDTVSTRKDCFDAMPSCQYEESISEKKILDFVKCEMCLKKYEFPHHEHKFVKMTEQEEREYVNYLNEAKITLRSIIEKQSEFKIYHGYYRVK